MWRRSRPSPSSRERGRPCPLAAAVAALLVVLALLASCGPRPAGYAGPPGGAASEPASGAGGFGPRPSETSEAASEPAPAAGGSWSEPGPPSESSEAARLAGLGLTPSPARVPPGPLPPDETGQVMVLVYHSISATEGRWSRTPEGLRRDLAALYERGYRPIGAADFVAGRIDVPKGYTPVVLTFDDATEGQFRILPRPDGSDTPPSSLAEALARLDPDSAVGILVAFHEAHPDWPLRATFYVNLGDVPFGQPDDAAVKLRLLLALGFEIGNHTLTHADLSKADREETVHQVGEDERRIEELLRGYRMRTLALPYGREPRFPDEARSGEYRGVSYRNEAFFLVGSNPAPSPFVSSFDVWRVPRVQVVDPSLRLPMTFPYTWLDAFDRHPERRFVSDGDPATVAAPRAAAGRLVPGGRKVVWLDEDR